FTLPPTVVQDGRLATGICQPFPPVKFRRGHDPRDPSNTSAEPGESQWRGGARGRGTDHATVRAQCTRGSFSNAAWNHSRPCDSIAPSFRALFRMRAGSVTRIAGFAIAGGCFLWERTVLYRRRDCGWSVGRYDRMKCQLSVGCCPMPNELG